jgi:hypothetical protein
VNPTHSKRWNEWGTRRYESIDPTHPKPTDEWGTRAVHFPVTPSRDRYHQLHSHFGTAQVTKGHALSCTPLVTEYLTFRLTFP